MTSCKELIPDQKAADRLYVYFKEELQLLHQVSQERFNETGQTDMNKLLVMNV